MPTAELQAIHDWIDSDADYQASDMFRMLNLVRYTRPRTFRTYVARRRAQSKLRVAEGVLPPSSPSSAQLEELTRASIGKALLTGEIPAYALPGVLGAVMKLAGHQLDVNADRRAEELHQAKVAAMAAKVDELAEAGELTEDAVATIRARVFGL